MNLMCTFSRSSTSDFNGSLWPRNDDISFVTANHEERRHLVGGLAATGVWYAVWFTVGSIVGGGIHERDMADGPEAFLRRACDAEEP